MTTRVVVLADTHMPRRGRELPPPVLQTLSETGVLIHLGDFTETEMVERLEAFGTLHAVHGNNDSEEVRTRFPAVQRVTIEGKTLVLIHGDVGARTAVQAARTLSDGDAVLFGHSHHSYCNRENGRLLFNPGSPTDKRWSRRSFGILEIGDEIKAKIIGL
jgi:uncharacterized protein